jgi:acyl carrier protein
MNGRGLSSVESLSRTRKPCTHPVLDESRISDGLPAPSLGGKPDGRAPSLQRFYCLGSGDRQGSQIGWSGGTSLEGKIIELIAQVKGDGTLVEKINSSSNLVEDAGLDSLQLINLILLVESEFNVQVDFESFDIKHLQSLDKFAGYIKGLTPA